MSNDAVRDFLSGGGAKSFAFDNVGDSVAGEIVDTDVRQQTDMITGEPVYWQDGKPKNALVITLQTDLQDDDNDDGKRSVWIRGGNFTPASGKGNSSLNALRDAMKAKGATDVEVGAQLRMTHTGMGTKKSAGMNAPKLYEIEYQPPSRNVSLDELG